MYPNLFFNKNKFWPHFHAADLSSHWLILCLYLKFIYFTKIYISSLQTLLSAYSTLFLQYFRRSLKSLLKGSCGFFLSCLYLRLQNFELWAGPGPDLHLTQSKTLNLDNYSPCRIQNRYRRKDFHILDSERQKQIILVLGF